MKKVKPNKLGRRIVSIILTVALMEGLVPGNVLTVSAADTEGVASVTRGERTESYDDLIDAFNSVVANEEVTITLLKDIDLDDKICTTAQSCKITLDLNGKTVSGTHKDGVLMINDKASVRVIDSGTGGTIIGSNESSYTTGNDFSSIIHYRGVVSVLNGKFILENGNISNTNNEDGGYGIFVCDTSSEIVISGGNISAGSVALWMEEAKGTISGGSFSGDLYDLMGNGNIILSVAEGKSVGATFPRGISVSGCNLNDICDKNVSYWYDDGAVATMLPTVPDDDTEIILDDGTKIIINNGTQIIINKGDITMKRTCGHEKKEYALDENSGHVWSCADCNNKESHDHTLRYSENEISYYCGKCGKIGTATITAEDKTYDGEAVSASVETAGVLENTDFDIVYATEDGDILDRPPVDAGTYTASITLEEDDGNDENGSGDDIELAAAFFALEANTASVEFTIEKVDPVITWNDQTVACTDAGNGIAAPTLKFIKSDNPEVELSYSYKAQGDDNYTNGLPSAKGTYELKVNVPELSNYNAVEKTITLTISCTDADSDGYCDDCGTIINGIGVNLAGHSVSLGGQIGMNFYMDLDDSVLKDESAYMLFTFADNSTQNVMVKDVKTSPVTINKKTYYVFTCKVDAREMADTVKAKMVCKDGTKEGTEYTYSVKQYAEKLIKNGATDEEAALVKAMLNYGAYAQEYFGYNTNQLANNGQMDDVTEGFTQAKKAALTACKPVVTGNNAAFAYAGSTLILEADIKVRHYFKLTNETALDSLNGLTLYVAQQGNPVDGTYYYYESNGIAAAELGTMTEYTGVNGISINYCPLSYVTTVVSNNATDLTKGEEAVKLQNLMKALYLYYQAVTNYNAV